MGEIDMQPAEVHVMGNSARDVADTSLTKARKAMKGADEDQAGMGLDRFATRASLWHLIDARYDSAKNDVKSIDAVGDNLHASASAVEGGDADGADVFGKVAVHQNRGAL